MKSTLSFQIKVVGDFCNMRCSYCRFRDHQQNTPTFMENDTLSRLIDMIAAIPQNSIRLTWRGGEPLLHEYSLLESIIVRQSLYPSKSWHNSVQTNGTIVDHRWAELLKRFAFSVGVSIDGNSLTHDRNRHLISGAGSYALAMRGVNKLRRAGIEPGIICVVTNETAKEGAGVLRSLYNNGFRKISFNPLWNTATEASPDEHAVLEDDWFLFLKDVFETWLHIDDPDLRVREIDAILAWTKGRVANSCSFKGSCRQWLLIDYNGDVHPCERYGNEIIFGNLYRLNRLEDIFVTSCHKRWVTESEIVNERCKVCHHLLSCQNGCTRHRRPDSAGPLYAFCDSRKKLFEYINNKTASMEV